MTKRALFRAAAAIAMAALLPGIASARDHPGKPIRLVVPFPPAGTPMPIADFIKSEHAKWGAVVREAGINLD